MRPVIYIAGPYRAPTAWRVQAHIRAAQEVALAVWKRGAVALCPHSNTGQFEGECPDEVWLEGDLELMRRCDAVLLVEGWQRSSGTLAEIDAAEAVGLPVFTHLEELDAWLSTRDAIAPSTAPPLSELVTCTLKDPDWVAHPRRLDCEHEMPHLMASCGAFHPPPAQTSWTATVPLRVSTT